MYVKNSEFSSWLKRAFIATHDLILIFLGFWITLLKN